MAELIRDFYYSLYSGSLKYYVRSVGNLKITKNFTDPRKLDYYGEIIWCLDGAAYFYLEDKPVLLQPDQVWYYPPGAVQRFRTGKKGLSFRLLTIAGEHCREFFEDLGFRAGLYDSGKCPEELFDNIEKNILKPSHEKRMETLANAFKILTRVITSPEQTSPQILVEKLKKYIDEHFPSNELNVCRIAELFKVHRVVLNRKFKASYDITLSDYLISKRLHAALELLKNSSLSLDKIAAQCGFSSAVYFNKAIRKATGRPPGKLRELFSA